MIMTFLFYLVASRVFYFTLLSIFADGLVSFSTTLSGEMDGFRKIDHFLGISVDECWKECGRHMSCAHAAYERRYQLCTLLEGPETPPMPAPGFMVASKGSDTIVEPPDCSACKDGDKCSADGGTTTCTITACGSPNTTGRSDLIVRGNMYKVHSKLRVECAKASDVFQTITCLANGSWSAITIKCEPSCGVEEALISGNNPIPDAQMTASCEYDDRHGPRYARINSDKAWVCSPAENDAQEPRLYIQVDFLNLRTVVAIQTRGRKDDVQYIMLFRLELSQDCDTFCPLFDASGLNVTFTANTDHLSLVENRLSSAVVARCLRLFPLAWTGWCSLRMEVLGCRFK